MSELKRVQPQQLEDTAGSIRDHAARIQAAIDEIDNQIRRMGPDAFKGQRADALRSRYNQLRETLMGFTPLLQDFGTNLDNTASSFRQADRANQ